MLAADPEYRFCALYGQQGHICAGRITWEHSVTYAGKQAQEHFAIVPLCALAHSVDRFQDGGELDKEVNLWIALNRASSDELRAFSKAIDYSRELARLNAKYGPYIRKYPEWFLVKHIPVDKRVDSRALSTV